MTRGTTPVIAFKFKQNSVSDITQAYLTVKQVNNTVEKDLSSAVVDTEANTIGWTLSQTETLQFLSEGDVSVQIRYKVGDVAGASRIQKIPVSAILKEGSI